ncbi:MAG: hypothetical protein KatS3mg112_0355 [Thermogutta sp.]|nr:MAG: hypothetical protein KatS3mg112_0355 [Thermogutta sp.]
MTIRPASRRRDKMRTFRPTCPRGHSWTALALKGTCLSGPPVNVLVTPTRRDPIWRDPLSGRHIGGTCSSGPLVNLGCSIQFTRAPVGAIHELPLPRWCRRDPLVGSTYRRDLLVRSDEHRLAIHPASPGTTSVPLRFLENPSRRNIPRRDLLVRSVCLPASAIIRFPFPGHDKRAPPIFGKPFAPKHPSEGPACQVRRLTLDHPLPFGGD